MSNTKRERQRANREAKKAAEAKLAARRKSFRTIRNALIIAGVVIAIGLAINLASGDDAPPTTTAALDATTTTEPSTSTTLDDSATTTTVAEAPELGPSDYAGYAAQPVACGGTLPPVPTSEQYAAPADQGFGVEGTVRAVMTTSCGDIVFELDAGRAPQTVNSFAFLAGEGYFDGIAFHRIIPGFMAQGGDPSATGTSGPGYTIPDELPPAEGLIYERGVLAMANAGPNTSGSQFFIMFADNTNLSYNFTVFGNVVDGFDTLDAIESVQIGLRASGELSNPLETVFIESVVIES